MPKGTYNKTKTRCPAGHPYDAANTAYTKAGSRYCRTCARKRSAARAKLPERREYERTWVAANRDKVIANNRRYQGQNRDKAFAYSLWSSHGLRPEDWSALWDAQDGKCYLCGDEMEQLTGNRQRKGPTAVIDHDHSCCPQGKSCSVCRRGLAHSACNSAIGLLFDDPVKLRRAAEAFEVAQAAFQNRKRTAAELLF